MAAGAPLLDDTFQTPRDLGRCAQDTSLRACSVCNAGGEKPDGRAEMESCGPPGGAERENSSNQNDLARNTGRVLGLSQCYA